MTFAVAGSTSSMNDPPDPFETKECERFVLDHIGRRESLAVETTLRTTVAIEQAELAQKHGRERPARAKAEIAFCEGFLAMRNCVAA